MLRVTLAVALFLALFLSGFSGIVNQIVWQRALKVFLGGSETLSSMTVVLVFMLGLGSGSLFAARRAARLRNPAIVFAWVEAALFLVNLVIAGILSLDISQTIYTFQSFAVSLGLPLRLLYVAGAVLLLGVPCFLMGITMPLASEVCQRQLHWTESRLLGLLFCVNTGGAVLGAVASGFYLLPYHGQFVSLAVAAALNGLAAIMAGVWVWKHSGDRLEVRHDVVEPTPSRASALSRSLRPLAVTHEEILGFATGFLALGYEMYLFRLNTLLWKPLPYTFAVTLCGFLFLWSLGIYAAAKRANDWGAVSVVGAIVIAVTPLLYAFQRWEDPTLAIRFVLAIVYFLPCLAFGMIYGRLLADNAAAPSLSPARVASDPALGARSDDRHWGRDVGRFYALNTIGSCAGILFFTLVGYEFDPKYNAWLISIGLLWVVCHALANRSRRQNGPVLRFRTAQVALAGFAVLIGTQSASARFTMQSNGIRSYYGRDGVVEIEPTGKMMWDGMDHSYLPRAGSQIGRPNWLMATVPVLCHDGPKIRDVLVIGLGCGVTASTLSLLESIDQVDVYDINHTLKPFLDDFRRDSLDVMSNSRINLVWQDGRSGLALNSKKYDIITQQPLYLSQAGSSILLSREYMELVRSRLKPKGIFCIYSNSLGNRSQNLLVRQTVRSVFKYHASFRNEYMLIASDTPIDLDRFSWDSKYDQDSAFFAQIRSYETRVQREGPNSGLVSLYELHDDYPMSWQLTDDIISDDHPLVEYPDVVSRLVPIARRSSRP